MDDGVLVALIGAVATLITGISTAFMTEKVIPGSRYRDKVEECTRLTSALEAAKDELWNVKLELSQMTIRREMEQRAGPVRGKSRESAS